MGLRDAAGQLTAESTARLHCGRVDARVFWGPGGAHGAQGAGREPRRAELGAVILKPNLETNLSGQNTAPRTVLLRVGTC